MLLSAVRDTMQLLDDDRGVSEVLGPRDGDGAGADHDGTAPDLLAPGVLNDTVVRLAVAGSRDPDSVTGERHAADEWERRLGNYSRTRTTPARNT